MKNFRYLILILIFACKDSTLIPDKDCAGVIGGEAVIDDCGYCTGSNTKVTFNQMLGCDNLCSGSKFDINGTCCPISDWDCNGVCTGSDTLDCQSVCNGEAHLFISGTNDWIDVNGSQEFDDGDYYYDNDSIKVYFDFLDSLESIGIENPCCFVDKCNECDLDKENDCKLDCFGVWGGKAETDTCGVCAGGETGIVPSDILELENSNIEYFGDNIDCKGVCKPGTSQGEIDFNSGLTYGSFIDNCGVCDLFYNVEINSSCTNSFDTGYDCALTATECHSPGSWESDLTYNNEAECSPGELNDSECFRCWGGPKDPDLDENQKCCYSYNYFQQGDSLRQDCNKKCGGTAWEDYCGACIDTTLTSSNNTSNGTCEIATSANTKNECVGDSAASYKLWGRWDEVNNICYCPLSSGIMYPEGRSEVGNFINNCDLCVQIGSGDTNAGCVTTSD